MTKGASRRRSSAMQSVLRTISIQRLSVIGERGAARADAVRVLAREKQWYRAGEGAERFLLTQSGAVKAPVRKAALDLIVAWHGETQGRFTHDGFEWRWKPGRRAGPGLVRQTRSGKLFAGMPLPVRL